MKDTPQEGGSDTTLGNAWCTPLFDTRRLNSTGLAVSVVESAPSGDPDTNHRKGSDGERSREAASPSRSEPHPSGGGEATTRGKPQRRLSVRRSGVRRVDGHESAVGMYRLLEAWEGQGHE